MNKNLASQLELLLSGVSDHGARHLAEVETDLAQTVSLLGEAIEKLGASFMAIHDAARAQQEMVNVLVSEKAIAPENIAKLKAMSGEMNRHVSAAVTNLQFHDLTSQLIGHVLQRVAGLQEVLAAFGADRFAAPPDSGDEQIIAFLNRVNEKVAKLDSVLCKTVRQDHMESGEIELF
jgi:hypothetical protein